MAVRHAERMATSPRGTLPRAEGPAFAYTPENRARLEEICTRYPPERRKSAILHALYLAQQQQGHITLNAMRHVAEVIGCTPAEVEDVVSYYVMFFTRPVGKYVLQVCRTLSCALMGAERVTEELSHDARHQAGRDRRGAASSRCSRSSASAPATARRSSASTTTGTSARSPRTCRALVDGLRTQGRGRRSRAAILRWRQSQ